MDIDSHCLVRGLKPLDSLSFIALAIVTFLAASIQAATGFGFAILAVPFFLVILNSLAAVQIVAVINFFLSLVIIPWLWKSVPRKPFFNLMIGSSIGFPVGLYLFVNADVTSAKLAAGILITLLAAFLLYREVKSGSADKGKLPANGTSLEQNSSGAQIGIGFLSGVMGAALAMPGPALMIYMILAKASKQISRALLLTLFAYSYGTIALIHTFWGGMTMTSWTVSVTLVPFIFSGAWAGNLLSRFLSENRFRYLVLTILIVSGFYAIWTAI